MREAAPPHQPDGKNPSGRCRASPQIWPYVRLKWLDTMLRVVVVEAAQAELAATLEVVLAMRWPSPVILPCDDVASALESVQSSDPHLIVVCPSGDMAPVYEFIVPAKTVSGAAVVLLSDDIDYLDRVKALESGADDCISATCVPIELLARINAILRRTMPGNSKPRVCGPVRLDTTTRSVTVFDTEVPVSPREFSLLSRLSESPNVPVSHRDLLCTVWGPAYQDDTELLRKSIFRLREKLRQYTEHASALIVNHRGAGYALSDGITTEAGLPERSDVAHAPLSFAGLVKGSRILNFRTP